MKKFKKVLVGLDLSELDDILIEKTLHFSDFFGIEKIYFVHVANDLVLPPEISTAYPDLLAPIDESIEKEIHNCIQKFGLTGNLEIEIEVKEGNPFETILRWSKIKDVDLVIMGRKLKLDGSGSLAKSIAQKSPCSILFFTETKSIRPFHHLMIPIDFSSYSHLTFELAASLGNSAKTNITGFHLYEVPAGYSKTGKSYKEFGEIMRNNAIKEYSAFQKKYHLTDYPCKFVLKDKESEAKYLIEEAKNENVDLIIIGSRGRSKSAAILLGSVAEKLIQTNNEIPMLIFKKKGENMGFLEALLKI